MTSAAQSEPILLPLLERETALARLRQALEDAEAGEGRAVLLHGEAGVGKTALVHRFVEESRGRARVLVGSCDPLFTPRPLGPFADIAESTGGELRHLVDTGAIPYRIAGVLLEDLISHVPTLLVLEDVHWADEASLDVVRLLARRITEVPVLMIATYRDDELDATHPLRVVLGGLASVRGVRRTRLEPLSRTAVTQLAEPYGTDADDLYRMTSGNPFFVTEVLAGSPDEVPSTIRDAVLARVMRLSPDARAILEAVSIAPTGTELWLLEALAGPLDGALSECLSSGALVTASGAIAFRHELARLTIEDSLRPDRRASLHRKALTALEAQPVERHDLARLAHHADAAGDADAVLELAPKAGERASSVGAHREAAAQYQRALRHAEGRPPEERATLLKQYAHECYLTDELEEAIRALNDTGACYRELDDREAEGATLTWISNILWCPGRGEEAREMALQAVALLEELPPGSALAMAYDNLAFLHRMNADLETARHWADRAITLARELDDSEAVAFFSDNAVFLDVWQGAPGAVEAMKRRIDLFRREGREVDAAHMVDALVIAIAFRGPLTPARGYIEAGLVHSRNQGLDLAHLYLLADRARLELEEGRWEAAAETAELVLGEHFVSTYPRTLALATLGLVRARRGDPEVWPVLDQALELSEPTGELPRIAPVAAARAEAAWLASRRDAVGTESDAAFQLALVRRAPRAVGELATLRRRAGIDVGLPEDAPAPYRHELAGDWRGAASAWDELGCPYEKALALYDGDEDALREALDLCSQLGAQPLATMIGRRLRELGVSVPRGPRPSTRENPALLTSRQLEVLGLLADGLRNTEIAERLVVSRRTVDHHVSAILRKLRARTRGEAVAEASRLGLLEDR